MSNFNIEIEVLTANYLDMKGDYPGSSEYNRLLNKEEFYFTGSNADKEIRQKRTELNNNLANFIQSIRSDFNPEEDVPNDFVELSLYVDEKFPVIAYIINRKDISEEHKNLIYKKISKYFLFPNTEQILKDLIKCNKLLDQFGYEPIQSKTEENKMTKPSFNNLYEESEIKSYILDETTLKDLLMTAGLVAGAGAVIHGGTNELNKTYGNVSDKEFIAQQPEDDYLIVPDKSKMPNLWKDVKSYQDKLEVPDKKDMPNLWDNETEPEKVQIQPQKKLDTSWSSESWKDADGKEWRLNDALAFIVDEEDFTEKAYKDGMVTIKGKKVPRYSIGYGTLSPNNNPRATITRKEAKKAMVDHVKKHILPKLQHFTFDSQNQFNSIISFVYNTGKLPPLNNQGKIDWNRFTQYNKFQGKTNSGLQRRRNAEFFNAQLFDDL